MTQRQVMVEMRVPRRASEQRIEELVEQLADDGFHRDPDYFVPLPTSTGKTRRFRTILLRGQIEEGLEIRLESRWDVVRIWSDAKIEAFSASEEEEAEESSKSPFTFGF